MPTTPKELDKRWARFVSKAVREKYVITETKDATTAYGLKPDEIPPELIAAKSKHDLKYPRKVPAPGGNFFIFLYKDV